MGKKRKFAFGLNEQQKNYGSIAEKRVDGALAELTKEGVFNFWFRSPQKIDAEGIDHIFGQLQPRFAVWVLQVTSGKKKRRTYYRVLSETELLKTKKPYSRRQYHRYIPLLVVTRRTSDVQIRKKLKRIASAYRTIFKSRYCPPRLKSLLTDFLNSRGIAVSQVVAKDTPQ
ncbi:MAG: hypothetical protein Q7R91_00770 [bacterium]|nr:hypothetical protein [bacterium]